MLSENLSDSVKRYR